MEVIELNLDEIINTKNRDLTIKIYEYLNSSLETWLGRYYLLISESKEIIKGKTKEEILNMAHVYSKNGFDHAAYKLYNEYIKRFPNDKENINDVKNKLSNIEPIEEPLSKKDNVFHYKKGYCLYTELGGSDKLYIIKSGKIGIYNVVNLHQITRSIYSKNSIIDGYNPALEYQPLSTSAIILEDSVLKVLKKEELLNIIENDNSIKLYYIRMLSIKIRNTILKIIALNTDDMLAKLLITLYYIVKTETLPNNIDSINLPYKVNDIKATNITPLAVKEKIDDRIINPTESNIYNSEYISNLVYLSLNEIVTNSNVSIGICQNCGKYFISYKKAPEKYCRITYSENEEICKDIGIQVTYKKKQKQNPCLSLYRKTYQKKLMYAKRSENENIKHKFDNWKKLAKEKVKEFNNGVISENELIDWLKNS